ncbi:MAG: formylglycine-generating enzyme family protein [Promicromonosporaceae bacterium]|nr:formylglycine-generating enzyme family protein [Promicromonosporaceae bacterium]
MLKQGGKTNPAAIKNSGEPLPVPPVCEPDIFEYADERADYRVIDGFDMMRVRSGTFMMGATKDQGWEVEKNEKPAHQVTLTRDYYMGLFPVTQKQWVQIMNFNPSQLQRNDHSLQTQIEWAAVLGANPSRFAGNDFYPVECVNFANVQEFISRLNQKTGKKFRLPTEAEWEYAARGGLQSQRFMYAGSNEIKEAATMESLDAKVTPTGIKDCNELGLYDMTGNVSEWVNDYMGDYTEEPKTDPTGPSGPVEDDRPERVIRGSGDGSRRGQARLGL